MVNLRRVEDRPTPPEVYNWRLWALAAIAALNAIMIGYDSAFVGGAITLKGFTNDFGKIPLDTSANLVTTYQAGAFFGAFIGYPLGYYWGRKWGIFLAAIVFTIGSIIMVIASPSTGLGPVYAGRAIAGLAIGAASNLGPIYIAGTLLQHKGNKSFDRLLRIFLPCLHSQRSLCPPSVDNWSASTKSVGNLEGSSDSSSTTVLLCTFPT